MLQTVGLLLATYTFFRFVQFAMRPAEGPAVRALSVIAGLVTVFLTYVLMTSGVHAPNP